MVDFWARSRAYSGGKNIGPVLLKSVLSWCPQSIQNSDQSNKFADLCETISNRNQGLKYQPQYHKQQSRNTENTPESERDV